MKVFRISLPDPALRISIRSGCTSEIIPLSDVLYCSAERNYTRFHLVSGKKCLSSSGLMQVHEMLAQQGFILINKSCLVNSMHIRSFSSNGRNVIMLSNNVTLTVSRRRKALLLELLKQAGERLQP